MTRANKDVRGRSGTLTLELLLVLPVATILILAMVEFSLIFVARQQLTAASREGARVAAIGGSKEEVGDAVRTFLGGGSLANADVKAVLEDKSGAPLPSGGYVQVVVSLPTARAVPNLLASFGFSIAGDVLSARTIMRKE